MVARLLWEQDAAGSNPVAWTTPLLDRPPAGRRHAPVAQRWSFCLPSRMLRVRVPSGAPILGCRQAARHGILVPIFAGSNPATPAIRWNSSVGRAVHSYCTGHRFNSDFQLQSSIGHACVCVASSPLSCNLGERPAVPGRRPTGIGASRRDASRRICWHSSVGRAGIL